MTGTKLHAVKTPGRLKAIAIALALAGLAPFAHAVTPDETLKDPRLETRAREISQHLRCVVCQNQSIDDSSAPLAHDLRVLVRDRLTAGDSDKDTLAYIVARYGNFVLLKPPVQSNTLLLWFGPLLLLGLAGTLFIRFLRAQDTAPVAEADGGLTTDERQRLDALTRKGPSV